MSKKQFKSMCREIGCITDEGKVDYEWIATMMWLYKHGEQIKAENDGHDGCAKLYQREKDIIDKYMGKEQ